MHAGLRESSQVKKMEIRDDVREGFEKKLRKEPTCVFSDVIKIYPKMKVLVATEKPFAKVAVDGIREVVSQLAQMTYNKLHFVIGTVNDKDIDHILQLLPHNCEYYFCKADIPRGLDAEILAQKAFELGLRGNVYSSVRDAYLSALNAASFDDVVFIGGSNFTVAEVI